ncbi:OTU protein [Sporothrix curviconia]|uniref:OTU protein n=1 Tax=Sporothrix curviconia TaxID=1260050 RepID=A0ABP0BR19_9PEZI
MESVEEIQARHRRELRDLQGRITNKKKNATKKTRKGVNDECAALEQSTRERHQAELLAATGSGSGGDDEDARAEDGPEEGEQNDDADASKPPQKGDDEADAVADKLADASIGSSSAAEPSQQQQQQQPKKRNRQKDRMARRAAEVEELAAQAAEEAKHMKDNKAIEQEKMKPLIAKSGRAEHEIAPDGHCLFSAVADQLAGVGRSVQLVPDDAGRAPYRVVRHAAARYMEEHPDDFVPFLAAADEGADLATYVAKIRDDTLWGGEMELMALANQYDVRIRVLHDGRSELIRPAGDDGGDEGDGGEEDADARPTLWLVFYRHGYTLGEHYNSLRKKPAV